MKQPTFQQTQCFFQSYGLLPIKEHLYTNGEVARHDWTSCQINEMVFLKMMVEATKLFGKKFHDLVSKEMGKSFGVYSMITIDWNELREHHNKTFAENES
jgi:hypothetical protein